MIAPPVWILLAALQLNWPTYGFTLENTRHAAIAQITPQNVAGLTKVWRYRAGVGGRMEATPIVVGSTMYVTTGPRNEVIALDAVTGTPKWRFDPKLGTAAICCGLINRGVAVANGRVFLATLDARLIALNAANGKPVWQTHIGRAADGLSETMAPLVWDGTVYIGSSGGDFGIRGSFSAYRAADGKLLWRWYAVGPGWEGRYVTSVHGYSLHRNVALEKRDAAKYANAWKHGGGPVWMTPALDPKTGTIFLSTGNPGPSYNGTIRPGDNLYTDSIVALDARTGRMRWYYQETPHDVWDYDSASPPLLFDALDASGKRVPAVGEAPKSGWFYILNRQTGKLIRLSQSLVPTAHAYADPGKDNSLEEPGGLGGVIGPLSYDPARHYVYVMALDRPEYRDQAPAVPAWDPARGRYEAGNTVPVGYWRDFLDAIDVDTGKIVWRKTLATGPIGDYGGRVVEGTLSAGNLVFGSDPDGHLYAFDASSGETKWQYDLGADASEPLTARFIGWLRGVKHWLFRQAPVDAPAARVDASPIVYAAGGREYIAIAAELHPDSAGSDSSVTVFALPKP